MGYSKRHCDPSIDEHETALTTFRNKMKQFRALQPLSVQRYVLYRWRFTMAAALCRDFDRFGGTIAQMNNLSIIMQISIPENPNISMLYDEELRNRLAKYARQGTQSIDYSALLSNLQIDIPRTVLRRVGNTLNQRRPPNKGWKDVKGNKGGKATGKGKGDKGESRTNPPMILKKVRLGPF